MSREIENLFKKWYKKQLKNENKAESSFIYDGSLSDEDLDQHEILFVCREANDKENKKLKSEFWFKNVVDGLETNGKKYYNCVNLIINYINNNINLDGNIELKKCAYLNINKKGGNSACDFKNLNEYAKIYKEYIIKEIQIINPKYIVILGKLSRAKSAEDIFIKYGQEHNIMVYIYDKHPCVYSKDIESHIRRINN